MTDLPNLTSGFAPVADGQLYYEQAGSGPALVLLHGGQNDRRMWDDQWVVFAQHYRVIRYDVRGVGQSPAPTVAFQNQDDLAVLLRHLGVARAHVMGQSLGARTAVNFALAYPAMTGALLPIAPGLDGYEFVAPELTETRGELMAAFQRGDVDRVVEMTMQTWIAGRGRTPEQLDRTVRARCEQMMRDNWSRPPNFSLMQEPKPPAITRLEEIQAPTLVILGDRDVADILTIADILTSRIPGARKVILPDAGHAVNMEHPAAFNQLVLDFLGSV